MASVLFSTFSTLLLVYSELRLLAGIVIASDLFIVSWRDLTS